MTDEDQVNQALAELWDTCDSTDAVQTVTDRIEELEAKLAEFRHALFWCGGSADFNEGGVAREGWLKMCAPLLKGESHD